ncbi:hypothetical protein BsWGS_03860 [Bradybaena similaris]
MLTSDAWRLSACFILWFMCCVRICQSSKEIFAEEGKEWSLSCVGKRTKNLKHMWWVSKNVILSKCHPGTENCVNYDPHQYTATQSETYQKFTSKLTIHQVGPGNRDQTFYCDDDGDGYNSQTFLLRVYHVPEAPVCAAEELSRGRIKVVCETSKVYPSIICEISQQLLPIVDNNNDSDVGSFTVHKGTILYQKRSFKEGTTEYNSAICLTTIDTSQPGLYRFKVKMYPGITNALVTSVDGYTNNVTIEFLVGRDGNGKQIKEEIANTSAVTAGKGGSQVLALTNGHGLGNQERETMKSNIHVHNEEAICENSKDEIIQRQLIVIMMLTILVVCTFFMNIFPGIRDCLCKRIKLKDPARV